jgi:archaellum component FlaC
MSRPPSQYNEIPNHIGNRYQTDQQTIDFKVGNPYACDPSDYPHSSVYAQAGFPGYAQQAMSAGYSMPTYNQISSQGAYTSQYPQPIASNACLSGYSQSYAPQSIAAPCMPVYSPAALESEAMVHDRIKANIDAIMEAQKTAMLNSKLETLTNKVQSLAQNIESSETAHVRSLSDRVERLSRNMADSGDGVHHIKSLSDKIERLSRNIADGGDGVNHIKSLSDRVENLSRNISGSGDSTEHIKTLSDKVERLSRSIELSRQHTTGGTVESLSSTTPVSTSATDSDIARRLRRLASESSSRQARTEEKIPDW